MRFKFLLLEGGKDEEAKNVGEREILEGESFPSTEGGELPLPLKRFSREAVDY